jgi:hypothetical protein
VRTQRFPLDDEQPPRLELRWEGSRAQVFLDGTQQATLDGFAGLKKGWSSVLEDGSTLEVRTIRRAGFSELAVLRNGQHVRSSPSHPEKVLRTSSNVLLALSIFLLITGIAGMWGRNWIDVVFGAMYLIGALLLRNRRRLGAAVTAIPLFLKLDLLLIVAFAEGIDRAWGVDVFFSLLFFSFVVRSYQAARETQLLALAPVSR